MFDMQRTNAVEQLLNELIVNNPYDLVVESLDTVFEVANENILPYLLQLTEKFKTIW